MTFASDKLYNGYLRRKMPTIVSKVKVREIVVHLPCLTAHDRENIEAKREQYGNYDGMVLLLDCLRRRENWPEQFIEALEACEQTTIAAEIRAEYDALRGPNNPNPSSPPTTVVRASVHQAPSAHLSVPESAQAAVASPTEAPAPQPAAASAPPLAEGSAPPPAEVVASPELAPDSSTPQEDDTQTEIPPSSAAQDPTATPEPELPEPELPEPELPEPELPEPELPEPELPEPELPEIPQPTEAEVAAAPKTPPPSPVIPPLQANTPHAPQRELIGHQEPEENSESDILDVAEDSDGIPDLVGSENLKVLVSSVAPPRPSSPVEECETDDLDRPDSPAPTVEISPPRSPSPTPNSRVTDASPYPSPERLPIQDTSPPLEEEVAVTLPPEETPEPPSTQTERPVTSSTSTAPASDNSLSHDVSVCPSKPEQLISFEPQNPSIPADLASTLVLEPYSGSIGRLEISDAADDTTPLGHLPACTAANSDVVNITAALPCQVNGLAFNHDEPEENRYESFCPSTESQDERVNVVHVAEGPSVLNQDGQSSIPQPQIVNGETAKEMPTAPQITITMADAAPDVTSPAGDNCLPSEPLPADTEAETKTPQDPKEIAPRTPTANTKYFLTAAGVCACALLVAWRFK
ncbi:mitochondrial antiviral-signaling protein [Aulostomus maculatus]